MKKVASSKLFVLILRVAIGGIFIYAGSIKIQQPLEFADNIASFQILSTQLINLLALSLPFFEIIAGVILITGWKARIAALSFGMLSAIFAIALAQALFRGLEVDCGCFGSGEPSTSKALISLMRATLLAAGSFWLYRCDVSPSRFGGANVVISRGI